ncbi:Maf family protein [Sporosarcina obsidiansis]|uniref:Maf family protein n=1 Tax=Sporosarcina obsidiansis TaxID=2660748 RepID=UPI00129BF614|nr:Maf family protein [Sporosarcina obsidiansis]
MKFTSTKPIMLASSSPRRKELLELVGIEFTVRPSQVKEDLPFTPDEPERYAIRLSEQKAEAVFATAPDMMIIAADTIVVKDGKQYSKPANEAEAVDFLMELSGQTHEVITGVTVMTIDCKLQFASRTQVKFRTLNPSLVYSYVRSGDAADKAGAYGIQTAGMLFVEHIVGDYQNVVGLPVGELIEQMCQADLLTLEVGDA